MLGEGIVGAGVAVHGANDGDVVGPQKLGLRATEHHQHQRRQEHGGRSRHHRHGAAARHCGHGLARNSRRGQWSSPDWR